MKDYKNKGWIKIKNIIGLKQRKYIKNKIKMFLIQPLKPYKDRDINFIEINNKKYLSSFHELSDLKLIKKFATQKKIIKIAKKVLSASPKFRKCELFAKPAKYGIAAPNHQDNYYWNLSNPNAITFWIALDNSSKKNGAVHYYEGSHKLGLLKHKSSHVKGSSQTIAKKNVLKKFKKVVPSLMAGDALVHHSLIVHGSGPNRTNKSYSSITSN